ncbi:MAG: alpha/beta hydrolase [Clostridia bacterium]|nr:alpha/beta hydrolase [Clostridia bacterium]
MKTVFLHGLGQTADAWDGVLAFLPGTDALCLSLYTLSEGAYSYSNLRQSVEEQMEKIPAPFCLCGLSLGAVLALEYSVRHPEKTASLVLIAPQTDPPVWLMRLQMLLFRCMPEKAFGSMGLTKKDCIRLMGDMADLHLSRYVPQISCPTLVLCGEKDTANRKAAEQIAAGISGGKLQILPGAGHECNREAPEALADAIRTYIL